MQTFMLKTYKFQQSSVPSHLVVSAVESACFGDLYMKICNLAYCFLALAPTHKVEDSLFVPKLDSLVIYSDLHGATCF